MAEETITHKIQRCREIIRILREQYPDARCTLDFENPFQLLVAAIMAAQSTDEKVNQLTPELFAKYQTPEAFANADQHELEAMIRPSGFFRQKTKAIMLASRGIIERFDGEVPSNIDDLLSLHGIGRKTANMLLGVAFGQSAIIVDTHVKRVSNRLGLSFSPDSDKIEFELAEVLPREDWTHFNHLLVFHGRAICKAPTPLCEMCPVLSLCPFGQQRMKGRGK